MKKPVVYRLCTQDGDVYVGSTNNLNQRLMDHRSSLRRGVHRNSRLQKAYDNGCFISVTADECASREEAFT